MSEVNETVYISRMVALSVMLAKDDGRNVNGALVHVARKLRSQKISIEAHRALGYLLNSSNAERTIILNRFVAYALK